MKNLSTTFTCLAVAACAAGSASMAACGGSSVSPVSPTPVSFSAVGTGSSGALSANGAAAEANADQPPGAIGGFDSHEPAPDPQVFDGTYTGSTTGGDGPEALTLTVTNGVVSFTVGTDVIRGTVSGSGAITASGGLCTATVTGQITRTSSDGGAVYDGATATGTWSHPTTPVCGSAASGSWTATRTTPAPDPPTSVTGRWVGVTPDGMILEPGPGACDLEFDLQMDLTSSGTAVTGTATLRVRKFAEPQPAGGCTGGVETLSVNGTVGSGTISFSLQDRGGQTIVDFSGTFTATRMAGTLVSFGGRPGTFAVNRQ